MVDPDSLSCPEWQLSHYVSLCVTVVFALCPAAHYTIESCENCVQCCDRGARDDYYSKLLLSPKRWDPDHLVPLRRTHSTFINPPKLGVTSFLHHFPQPFSTRPGTSQIFGNSVISVSPNPNFPQGIKISHRTSAKKISTSNCNE